MEGAAKKQTDGVEHLVIISIEPHGEQRQGGLGQRNFAELGFE